MIGYIVLAIAFVLLLTTLPTFSQSGLSNAEIETATSSAYLGESGSLDLVDLPYKLLQKASISLLGLSAYAIKLPSVIIGLLLGLMLILLLNRWFKNNVSLLASSLIVFSTPFLFLAGSGTPLIMLVFWPTLLLWIGSKIQGEKRPKPLYSFVFAIALLLSIFTPYMIYFAVFCVLFVAFQPHLRFVVRSLPKLPLAIVMIVIIAGFGLLGFNIFNRPETMAELLTARDFEFGNFFSNIRAGIAPLLSWHGTIESVFLSPLISLPVFALALIGLFSTTKGFFASRNSIASLLIVFGLIITGFNPNAVIFAILPFSILVAHGIKYLLEKWYGLFPENPYARVSALFPLTVLFGAIIVPELMQYIYGYHYNPNVANEFSDTLTVVRENLTDETLVINENYDFYKILEASTSIKVADSIEEGVKRIATLGKMDGQTDAYTISRIVTSPKRDNSDIIYLYTYSEKGE